MTAWDGFDFARFMKPPKTRTRRARKPDCDLRKPLKAVLREIEKLPRTGADPRAQAHLDAFVAESKAACIRTCGGCELTRAPSAPPPKRKACRRTVLKLISGTEPAIQDGPFTLHTPATASAAFLVARCEACRKCGDMPPVTPHSLRGRPIRGGAAPPLRPVR